MPTTNTLLDDMLALGGSLFGNLVEARHELKAQAKNRAETLVRRLDLVTREEFDAAVSMLSKARAMQEELSDRLAAIESKLDITTPAKGSTKGAAKKKASTKMVKSTANNLPSVKQGKQSKKRG